MIKFLASVAVLIVVAVMFGTAWGLLRHYDLPNWAEILTGALALSLSFMSYKFACLTPFGRKYLYNWLGGPNGT